MSKIMGQRIHDKREELGLSIEDFAQKVGVARQTVYKWEKGQVKNIDRDCISKMAGIFHCDPEWLMHMEDSQIATITYKAPGRESVTAIVNKDPIIGAASLRAQLYQAAMIVKPENLNVAIELLKSLS